MDSYFFGTALVNRLTDLPRLKVLHRQAVLAGTLEEFEQFAENIAQRHDDASNSGAISETN